MKIAVVGMGYVGLSLAILLAQNNDVYALDINGEKIDKLSRKESPIRDQEIEDYLSNKNVHLTATTDEKLALKEAEFVIVAVSTDYDETCDYFDVSAVDEIIESVIETNSSATIVIKSTVPVGYTAKAMEKYSCDRIIFSPEFLRLSIISFVESSEKNS